MPLLPERVAQLLLYLRLTRTGQQCVRGVASSSCEVQRADDAWITGGAAVCRSTAKCTGPVTALPRLAHQQRTCPYTKPSVNSSELLLVVDSGCSVATVRQGLEAGCGTQPGFMTTCRW